MRQAVPVDRAPEEQAAETVRQLRALATPDGAVGAVPGGGAAGRRAPTRCAALTRLRAEVGTDLAGPAWGIARQRQKARPTFGADADRLLFTGDTLEQAGRPELADRRAARLLAGGAASVADLGCAAGTDTIALARAGARVVAVDRDPVARELTRPNAAALGADRRRGGRRRRRRPGGRGRRRPGGRLRRRRPRSGPAGRRTAPARPRPLVAAVVDGDRAARPRADVGGQGGPRPRPRPGARRRRGGVGVGRRLDRRGAAVGARRRDHLAAGDPRARRRGPRADRGRRSRARPRSAAVRGGCTSPTRR